MQISAVEIPSLAGQTEFISAILVEDGQAVQQGQILAHLDSSGGSSADQPARLCGRAAGSAWNAVRRADLCLLPVHPSSISNRHSREANNPTGIDASTVILFGGGGTAK